MRVRVGEVYCRSIIMQRPETPHSLLVRSTLTPTETPCLVNGEIHIPFTNPLSVNCLKREIPYF